jgi:hypothetical protein
MAKAKPKPTEPLAFKPNTDAGREALDMVNILRQLRASETTQREAVYHFFCKEASPRRCSETSKR